MDFDFTTLGFGLAAVSLGMIGIIFTGAVLFQEQVEKAKRTWLPYVIIGIILLGVSGFIIASLGG